ncbi:site-specific DNA-methyltransferase [Candidatus Saccharibacteria bacterium]|nr:site-specific DNA-methyltransferase [Candidatus Saccharibacteria bacterium]
MKLNHIYNSSSEDMREIPDESVDLMVTSPPYNINISYGNKWENRKIVATKGQKYDDKMPEELYRLMLNNVLRESIRVLKPNGSMYLNMKNRMVKGNLISPNWVLDYLEKMHLKNIIIWQFDWGGSTNKRFASRYENIFFLTKNRDKWTFNLEDVMVPSVNYRPDRYKTQLKNPSDVWKIPLVSGNSVERTEHPAQYPEKMIERIIKVATNEGDVVLDPFMGSGTTALVSCRLKRKYIGYEIYPDYIDIAKKRLEQKIE